MIDLKGKVIILTGSEGLLGKAITKKLLASSATLIRADIANETKDLINGRIKVDLTKEEDIMLLIDKTLSQHKRIDGLVNNAYPRTEDWAAPWEKMKMDSWNANVKMQLNDMVYLLQQISSVMQEQQSGSIVNIASIYGVVGNDFAVYEGTDMTSPPAYAAIKGGIINLTRYLASYLGPSNVRVNCVSPGGIQDNQDKNFIINYSRKTPLRRMGKPEDISPAVAFLLSEDSSYITGHNLIIDGGWTSI